MVFYYSINKYWYSRNLAFHYCCNRLNINVKNFNFLYPINVCYAPLGSTTSPLGFIKIFYINIRSRYTGL